MAKFELFMGYLGNGCTVCNKAVMERGDYKQIAHISNAGNIKWYVEPAKIPGDALLRIEHVANAHRENFIKWFDSELADRPAALYERIVDRITWEEWKAHRAKKYESIRESCEALRDTYMARC